MNDAGDLELLALVVIVGQLLEDVAHRQVVFTIPKRLRVFFRYDRKLLGGLAGCAWRALKLYFDSYFDGADVTPGAAGFLQTSREKRDRYKYWSAHVLEVALIGPTAAAPAGAVSTGPRPSRESRGSDSRPW